MSANFHKSQINRNAIANADASCHFLICQTDGHKFARHTDIKPSAKVTENAILEKNGKSVQLRLVSGSRSTDKMIEQVQKERKKKERANVCSLRGHDRHKRWHSVVAGRATS